MTTPVLECSGPWDTECHCGSITHCWPRPDTSCCDRLEPTDPTPEQTARIERMLHVATETIWRLSGKQFGACPVTVRPCRQDCNKPSYQGYWSGNQWQPVLDHGVWFNEPCGKCGPTGCSCTEICEVDLGGVVSEIIEVKLDGRVLPETAYRVDDYRKLVSLIRPVPLAGDFMIASAFLDPTARFTVAPVPDAVPQGVDHGGGVYGPDGAGILHMVWRGIVCADVTYTGPADAAIVTSRPTVDQNVASEAWYWPAPGFQFVNGVDVASNAHDDTSSVLATLLAGTAVTSNPNPPPLSRNITVSDGTMIRFCPSQTGRFCWPTCQDMVGADTEPGTFSVRYRPGPPVPQGALWAAGLLACELLKACDADAECALPANAQRITRQGVDIDLTPVLVSGGNFMTGIGEVDLWLNSVNPFKAKMPSRVFSLDVPSPRTTWPCS